MTTKKPEWTRHENSTTLWVEDDATVGDPGHETLGKAWRRLFGSDLPEKPLESCDDGDATFNLYHGGVVAIASYPGNNNIRQLLDWPTTQATTTQEVIDLSTITRTPLTGDSFETFANYFIVEAVSRLGRDTVVRVFGEREKIEKAAICLTVNGVQLPFLAVLRRFHEAWERIINAEAVRLLEEKFSISTSDIFTLLDDLKQKLEEAVGKKNE
jgi:hypothetical protein